MKVIKNNIIKLPGLSNVIKSKITRSLCFNSQKNNSLKSELLDKSLAHVITLGWYLKKYLFLTRYNKLILVVYIINRFN